MQIFYNKWLNSELGAREIYYVRVVNGYSQEWCQEVSGHIIKWLWHVDLQRALDAPAFVIHHLLHPTNSLITLWKRWIQEAPPRLTINSKAARSGLTVYTYQDVASTENFLTNICIHFHICIHRKLSGLWNMLEGKSTRPSKLFMETLLSIMQTVFWRTPSLILHSEYELLPWGRGCRARTCKWNFLETSFLQMSITPEVLNFFLFLHDRKHTLIYVLFILLW